MCNRKFANLAVYLLFCANTAYAVRHGFGWLFWVAASLTAACLCLDLAALLRRKEGRRNG